MRGKKDANTEKKKPKTKHTTTSSQVNHMTWWWYLLGSLDKSWKDTTYPTVTDIPFGCQGSPSLSTCGHILQSPSCGESKTVEKSNAEHPGKKPDLVLLDVKKFEIAFGNFALNLATHSELQNVVWPRDKWRIWIFMQIGYFCLSFSNPNHRSTQTVHLLIGSQERQTSFIQPYFVKIN